MPRALQTLTYGIPEDLVGKIIEGQIVKIPFQNSEEFAIVKNISQSSPVDNKTLKPLLSFSNESEALSNEQLNFIEEISILYNCPLGILAKASLFGLQKKRIQTFEKSNLNLKLLTQRNENTEKIIYIYNNEEEKISYILKNLSLNQQHLIIVPEISHLKKLDRILTSFIKDKIGIITSDIKPKEFFEIWMKLRENKINIIIGTRRAFFLPWMHIQNIFILDEAHPSHKNSEGAPRFHNRDAARILASFHQAKVHLASHTPSIESFWLREEQNKHKNLPILNLRSFIAPTGPSTHLVDIKQEQRAKNFNALSNLASKNLHEAFQKNESVYVFLNSRGSFKQVACADCSYVFACEICKLSLSYHQISKKLFCHHCQKDYVLPAVCPSCTGAEFKMFGIGTQNLEADIKRIIPSNYQLLRIDKDMDLANSLKPDQPFVVIGTQFAWEKISWEKIKLMIWVNADAAFYIPEYKTTENLWYQLRDSSYRLLPGSKLVIQTSRPQHYVFQSLQFPIDFYKKELGFRIKYDYPPYVFLVKISIADISNQKSSLEADKTFNILSKLTKNDPSIKINSPINASPQFYKNKYWRVIVVKISPIKGWDSIMNITRSIPSNCKVDLNPENLLTHS
jgi:primosomal protein N' (replication factor Y)